LLADNKLPEISRLENSTLEQITECVKIIRCLNPKPGAEYAADALYMECEVEILKENENLTVKMLNNYEALQLRPEYYMTTDEAMTEFVKPYLKRIRLLVDTLNARERTLFSIVSNITEHQRNFFLKDGRLEPFTLKEVAEELGMHESTISRAISNKSVRFKNREIPLKYFFISKTVNGDSKDCVEERIKALIASEDKQHPLSDQKLSELMKKEGIVVARRTIAKYREQMGILPAAKRKVY
jgi:RNA polymerase sigma-54 factor